VAEVEFTTTVEIHKYVADAQGHFRDERGHFVADEIEEIEVTVEASVEPGESKYRHPDPGMCTPKIRASAEITSVKDENGDDVTSRLETPLSTWKSAPPRSTTTTRAVVVGCPAKITCTTGCGTKAIRPWATKPAGGWDNPC